MLYKFIVKVLATKMQAVWTTIICEAQEGFIPSQKIGDTIILAHKLVKEYTRKHILPRCMIKIDLQKAYNSMEYNSMEWIYTENIIIKLGFPTKYTN